MKIFNDKTNLESIFSKYRVVVLLITVGLLVTASWIGFKKYKMNQINSSIELNVPSAIHSDPSAAVQQGDIPSILYIEPSKK